MAERCIGEVVSHGTHTPESPCVQYTGFLLQPDIYSISNNMKRTHPLKDNEVLGDLYQMIFENTQINEGSTPFNSARFIDSLKNAARFISNGEMNELGLSGIRHTISRFHMDAAAKKEAARILQQQGMQLLAGASRPSEQTLDNIMKLIRHNQGEDTGVGSASIGHAMRGSSKPTADDYMHNPKSELKSGPNLNRDSAINNRGWSGPYGPASV